MAAKRTSHHLVSPDWLARVGEMLSSIGLSASNSVRSILCLLVVFAFLVSFQFEDERFKLEVEEAGKYLHDKCTHQDPMVMLDLANTEECREKLFVFKKPAMRTVLRRALGNVPVLYFASWLLMWSEPTYEDFKKGPVVTDYHRGDWMWALVSFLSHIDTVKALFIVAVVCYVLSKVYNTLAWFYPDLAFTQLCCAESKKQNKQRTRRGGEEYQGETAD